MGYLVNLVLDGKSAVVVGGGDVASRKVEDLLRAGAVVTVVAPAPCERIRTLAEERRIAGVWRAYETSDLRGAVLVIAATHDEAVNAQVSRDAQETGLPVNVVDRPALCTFTVPATLHRGDLTIAVATEGRSPAFAGILREELEARYGPEYGDFVRAMGELRQQWIAAGWSGARIREEVAARYREFVRNSREA